MSPKNRALPHHEIRMMFSKFSLPQFRFASRLSIRLFWYAVACSAMFTLLASAIQLWSSYQHDLDAIEQDMQFIAASYLPALNQSVYELDDAQLQLQLRGLLQFQHIAYVAVISQEKHIETFSAGDLNIKTDHVREFPLEYVITRYNKPNRLPLGKLRIAITLQGVYQRLLKNAVLIFLTNAAQIFLAACMLLVITHLLITRHLVTMANYTSSLDIHQLEGVLILHRHRPKQAKMDELDMVAAALNDLQARLRSDIIRRLRAEERLRAMYTELEMRVQQRTEELVIMNQELHRAKEAAEQANRSKTLFLANMSHELRTPLNVILGYAQILKQEKTFSAHEQKAIETIYHSGQHLLQMIDDLLDFSKIEAQKIELQSKDIILPVFLQHIANMMRIRAYQKQVQFITDFAPNLPASIVIDEHRLRQVLLNLLNNAVKYTEQGSIMFRVRLPDNAEKSPFISLRFEIQDTGIGIPADKIEKIFDAFYQIETGGAHIEGTGLGLAISRSLIHLMGSELCVESQMGEGSLFWFDLSVTASAEYAPEAVSQTRRIVGYTGTRQRILLVDDDAANLAVLRDMLLPFDFDIDDTRQGCIAIEKARQHRPDLIFLDMIMPDMDGLEVARRLRGISECGSVPIIAISASLSGSYHQECLAIGCNEFLSKPIYFDQLFQTLQRHLHVEWIYEEIGVDHQKMFTPDTPIHSVPALEDVQALFRAAQARNITAIKKWLDMFQQHGTEYQPFLANVRFYAAQYQFDSMVEFLTPYLRRTNS